MPVGMQILEAARVNRIMQALQDIRLLPQQLRFLQRTPIVPAVDGEIMARYLDRVQIADLIADDQRANTYSAGKMGYYANNIPNLKVGANVTQAMLNELDTINSNGGIPNDNGLYSDYEKRQIDKLLLGVRQRMESLIIAMKLDSFSYNRLGINMNGVSWGMPPDLKLTPGTTWDQVSATPVNDLTGVQLIGKVRYGITFDRVTMSTACFRYMIATTEFQNKARLFLAPNVSYTNLTLTNLTQQQQIAGNILGMEIELYDARAWSQAADGTMSQTPLLPITNVILESKANDNDAAVTDFGNGVTTESMVSSLLGGSMYGSLGGSQRGPIAYAAPTSPDLNPPGVTYWGVARGFPRKHMLASNAVLSVGSFADTIPSTELAQPFPS